MTAKSADLLDRLERLDLTNAALARLTGVAPSSVQRWTRGTIPPPVMLLRLLDCMVLLEEQQMQQVSMRTRWETEP